MPSIDQNIEELDKIYKWPEKGDEWYESCCSSDALWYWVIYPRIYNHLHLGTILEIAPGYGRFTQYLKNFCKDLYIVDLSESCIDYCKNRFQEYNNIMYFVNDGKSLESIPDNSIDFVFSFDSLEHAESDFLEEYIKQISKKLTKDGIAFIHHSNSKDFISLNKFLFDFKLRFITRRSPLRSKTVSSSLFSDYASKYNCSCISQELINWGGPYLIDCLSTITLNESKYSRQNKVIKNYNFMDEADIVRKLSKIY